MSVPSLLTFLPPVLTGGLIIHLLWADRKSPLDLVFQLSLGTGLGLGISSVLYYVYLLFFAGSHWFLYAEIALCLAVLTLAYSRYKGLLPFMRFDYAQREGFRPERSRRTVSSGNSDKKAFTPAPQLRMSFLQIAILAIALLVSGVSFLGLMNYSRQRAHGDWDAWMIYNRSARFIFRGGEFWRDAFSPDMDLVFHADYPPLLALNIASRWEMLGAETTSVPMLLGFLFSLASLGLCFGALANLKSLGQGALGLILLGGVQFFLSEGGRQTADVPLAFFMLASVVFLFFHYREKRADSAMVFAALMAGLAAWTKNEGLLFVLASAGVLFLMALWKRSFRGFLFYLAGLLLPLLLLFHFKTQVAPSSEFADGGLSVLLQKLTDLARHQLIFASFKGGFLFGSGWLGVGIYVILGAYLLLFYSRVRDNSPALLVCLAIFAAQFIGYYLFYLISPYDLNWHIGYSLNRLFLHPYPAFVFVALSASQIPETVFSAGME